MRLCQCVDHATRLNGRDVAFASIAADSRRVEPGVLFAALKGSAADGLDHVDEAIQRGAVAILGDARLESMELAVPSLIALDPRQSLARIAASLWPNQPSTLCAITGTNGKSSTAEFLRQLWRLKGIDAASLGTLGLKSSDFTVSESLTTPDPVTLHQWLDRMARSNVSHLALEASSHGLEQRRLDGLRPDAAAFTNLSRDHLDYHETLEAYFAAKLRLFTDLLREGGTAVLYADDPWTSRAKERLRADTKIITFGAGDADLRLAAQQPSGQGQAIDIEWQGRDYHIDSRLVGSFQALNLLTAAALAIATGSDGDDIIALLGEIKGAPGRMEHAASTASGGQIYVDFAHTPDALERALIDIRPHAAGRLIAIFGCGGDRDRGKRPEMGAIAQKFADIAILTDDNPRSEDPAAIRADARAGCPDCIEIGDRAEAITHGVSLLQPGDVLIVAGKGHEQGQKVGDVIIPFDDRTASIDAVRSLGLAA